MSDQQKCPCAYSDCKRHANCKECKAYHHARDEKTSCERLKQ